MNRLPLLIVLIFCCTVLSQPGEFRGSIHVYKNADIDSALNVGKRPTSTNLHTVAGWDSVGDTVKQMSIDSLTSDSVAHADHADTADVAFKSLLTTHGVTPGTVPKAATDSTFTNSHISENGDTTKITHVGSVADTLTYSGVSAVASIYAGCSAPNGDCYYAIEFTAPGFYIQSGGSGALTRVTSFTSGVSITAMISDPSGNIYGFRYWDGGGYIYKRTAGSGNFEIVATENREWVGGTCDKNGVLYGVTHHDSIYTSSDQGVTWTFLQKIYDASNIYFSNVAPDGALYLAVYRSVSQKTIYRKTSGQTQFYDMNIPGWWGAVGVDTSGNIFMTTSTSDGTYMSSDGLSSYRKIQNTRFSQCLFGKIDGKMNGTVGSAIWTKTADPLKTVFAVYGGNTKLAGKLTVNNTPLSASPAFLLVKNVEPDEEIRKFAWNDSVGKADSARIAGSVDGYSISSSTVTSTSYFIAPDNDTLKRISASNTLASLGLNDSLITKKVQVGSATNGAMIDSLGIHFRGTAQKWNDIADMNLSGVKGVGSAGEPTWTATGLGFSLNRFAIGDSAQGDGELMHEFAVGDTGDIHLHYHVNGQDAAPRHIGITFDVDVFNAFGDSSVFHYRSNIYDTIPANTKHMSQRIVSTGKIAMTSTGIGAKCYGTVIRIANGTAPSSDPFFSTIGIHKRIDEMGSTSIYTK